MIYLTKGQVLKDNPGMVVFDPTGYYNDSDSVICASIGFPEEPVCRYEAKFIAYGGMVYSISNPDDLMAEITKIDPASLFGKDNQQITVDKMVENIVPQESGKNVENATIEEVVSPAEVEPAPQSQSTDEQLTTEGGISTETNTPTTTPETNVVETMPSETVSTTPSITEDINNAAVSSSPAIDQTIETLTSTDSGL